MEWSGKLKEYTPHLLMTVSLLVLAIFIVFLQPLISIAGVSPLVFVLYEHSTSTLLLSSLAFFCERGRRPHFTVNIFIWAFGVGFLQLIFFPDRGFLQIVLGQLLLTASLGYISATFQTTVLNTSSAVTLLVAIILRREALRFCTVNGQAKLWGILLSALGAITMVVWSGPKLGALFYPSEPSQFSGRVIGCLMIVGSVLSAVSGSLLVEQVALKYPAEMSLSAMMCFCGTLQTGIIAGLTERSSSAWQISIHQELPVILYGGITVTGLSYYVQTWCIHKKGPVFTSAFSPLLIVFSFVFETFVWRKDAHLGSIVGAIFVILGLYLLLWAKADDDQEKLIRLSSSKGDYEQLI